MNLRMSRREIFDWRRCTGLWEWGGCRGGKRSAREWCGGSNRRAREARRWAVGVFALDTATGRHLEHRRGERFAMCSTFKFLAAAAILQRVDRGTDNLDRQIEYGDADLLEYAPVSKAHVKEAGWCSPMSAPPLLSGATTPRPISCCRFWAATRSDGIYQDAG